MADISNELSNIAKAIYGEEVRGSIYDAIARINAETEQAMSDMSDYRSVVDSVILSFNQWYANISEMFDGEIETNLANSIVGLKEDFENLVDRHEVIRSLVGEDDSYLEDGSGAIVSGRVVFCVAGDSENLTADMVYYDDANTLRAKLESMETNMGDHVGFAKISAGGGTINADNEFDELKLAAGTNVSLETNASTKTLKISSTNTTYGNMTGASTSAAGKAGLVPAPAAGAATRYLRSDGSWQVPPDTNTTYSNMSGASTSAAGAAGLVPAPSAGAATRYLRSDGTWQVPPDTNTTYNVMTGSTSSSAGAAGLVPPPAAGAATRYLRSDGSWQVPPNTTYGVMTGATNSAAGTSGLVPAPSAGPASRYLLCDGTWTGLPLMTGATSSTPGIAGLVPTPSSGHNTRFLRGDGTWQELPTLSSMLTASRDTGTVSLSPGTITRVSVEDLIHRHNVTVFAVTCSVPATLANSFYVTATPVHYAGADDDWYIVLQATAPSGGSMVQVSVTVNVYYI